jgi:copper chaperone
VSLDTQTATVHAEPSLDYETVLKTIKKTGKKVNSGEADGEPKSVELPTESKPVEKAEPIKVTE